jgi:hypothetical protein
MNKPIPLKSDSIYYKYCRCYHRDSKDTRCCGICNCFCKEETYTNWCPVNITSYFNSPCFLTNDGINKDWETYCCCTIVCFPVKCTMTFPFFLGSICNNLINIACCNKEHNNYFF